MIALLPAPRGGDLPRRVRVSVTALAALTALAAPCGLLLLGHELGAAASLPLLLSASSAALLVLPVLAGLAWALKRLLQRSAAALAAAAHAEHQRALQQQVDARTAELERARRAAEAASACKSAFLATVSHELRTPLNGVVGLAELLACSKLEPDQAELLGTLRESCFALVELVDDLLDLSKIEAGALELEHAPVRLRSLVETACDALLPGATRRSVALQVFVDPALPESLMLDAVRWRQILNNLVGNAIKFSAGLEREGLGRSGCVRVRVQRSASAAGEQLRLVVADNGIGMTAPALARVFEPYKQADASTTRRYGGTGLGLPIVQRLVRAFGGAIEVHSLPDEGTTVVVCIPLVAAEGKAAGRDDAALRGLHCMLCIDDPQLGADWAAYLAAAGAEVQPWPHPQALAPVLARVHDQARVAVVGSGWSAQALQELRSAAPLGSAGLVLIRRGAPRVPQRNADGEVAIDSDAVHAAALVDAVALAAGRAPGGRGDARASVNHALSSAALPRGLRVLVAEDNPVNQEVMRRQLALLGVQAEIVGDGETALARWGEGEHALLLTDLHMPGMDGCELTRRLRALERGGRRRPVIALSATVTRELDEDCRRAGMDDWLRKPVTLQRLAAVLRRWAPQQQPEPPAAAAWPAADTAATAALFDRQRLVQAVGEDAAAQARICQSFAIVARQDGDALHAALAAAQPATVMAAAHRLKGAAASVGALALAGLCARLEAAARAGDAQALAALGTGLEPALRSVLQELAAMQDGMQGGMPGVASIPAAQDGAPDPDMAPQPATAGRPG